MLIRHDPVGTWLVSGFLLAHGLIHAMFIPRQVARQSSARVEYPFSLDRSWLITRVGVKPTTIRALGTLLVVVTIGAYVLAALCTVGIGIPAAAWSPLIVVASMSSALLLLIAFAPGLVLGLAIDLVLLWMALTTAWQPGSAL
jgi:hypothetical protein